MWKVNVFVESENACVKMCVSRMWMCLKKVNTCLFMGNECVCKKWMCMFGMWRYVEKVKGCVKRETVESERVWNMKPSVESECV